MEAKRLAGLSAPLKWGITAYLLLASLGFCVAALMSHYHYGFDHAKTVTYYLGSESEMAMPKLYPQILQAAHVHSFTMPMVFLPVWLGLHFLSLSDGWKKLLIAGGALSILLYNSAPFLVRYESSSSVYLFTIGGIGLFLFFLVPAGFILKETWLGTRANNAK